MKKKIKTRNLLKNRGRNKRRNLKATQFKTITLKVVKRKAAKLKVLRPKPIRLRKHKIKPVLVIKKRKIRNHRSRVERIKHQIQLKIKKVVNLERLIFLLKTIKKVEI